MSDAPEQYGADRIIAFSDAVVAIAITVLLLPLADIDVTNGDVLGALQDHGQLLGGLTLTWLIIAVFWLAHHRLFTWVRAVDPLTLWLNFGWMFAIALLPLPTNIVIANDPSPQVTGFYIGWMTLISLLLTLILWHVGRRPGLMSEKVAHARSAREARIRTTMVTGVFVFCFLVALVAPEVALWFLLLQIPVDTVAARLADRRAA